MKVQRQTIDFAAVTRQTDRKPTTRNSSFDTILARESGVRRQETVTSSPGRQNPVTTPAAPAAARGDEVSTSGRLIRTVGLTPFGPPLLPPSGIVTAPPTVAPGTVAPANRSTTPAPPAAPTTGPQVNTARHPGITALRSTLAAMGLQTSGLQIEYTQEAVGFPGGSYMNRLISVRSPGGTWENYDAEMTLRNPQITASEMRTKFGLNG